MRITRHSKGPLNEKILGISIILRSCGYVICAILQKPWVQFAFQTLFDKRISMILKETSTFYFLRAFPQNPLGGLFSSWTKCLWKSISWLVYIPQYFLVIIIIIHKYLDLFRYVLLFSFLPDGVPVISRHVSLHRDIVRISFHFSFTLFSCFCFLFFVFVQLYIPV